jgi:Flp pilus assembly protein TadG
MGHLIFPRAWLPHSARPISQRFKGSGSRRSRPGLAVVELAVLLPILVMLFVVAVDFARVFYFSLTLTSCARAGALYACDPVAAVESPFTSVSDAALADATNLSPQPTISSASGVDDSGGAYVEVTAQYPFSTVTNFPGIPSMQLSRTVRMRLAANTPDTN